MKYSMNLNRRRLLTLTGTVATASVAGCSGEEGDDGSSDGSESDDNGSGRSTDDDAGNDGTDINGEGQDDGSTNDSSSDDGSTNGGGSSDGEDELEDGNIVETDPVEFENYTRDSFVVEIQDFCNDGTKYENWIGPNSNHLGFGLSILGQEGCEQVSRTNEAYDAETDTLTLELDFSAPDGATGCGGDCTVQHDVLAGYRVPVDWSEVSVEVYITRNGGEPELRTSWPVQN
jgi:hypothetical protein